MVSDDVDGESGALKVMPPGSEGVEDGKAALGGHFVL